MSNFTFLLAEFPAVHEAARRRVGSLPLHGTGS